MSEEFIGQRFRTERERRRITLESIAANTKISLSLLKALERDDVSRWPSGIFRRSFIRSYAEAIGLDPDQAVRDFLEHYPDPQPDVAGHGAPPAALIAAAPVPAKAGSETVLRLTLDDSPQPFSAGQLLEGMKSRLSAVAWDAGVTFAVAMTAYIFFQSFWAPLGVFMFFYYLCSVLILGNTPGVCLFAPDRHHRRPQPPASPEEDDLELSNVYSQRVTG
jgi:transcriptional regulator with XRE-family HTH domain